MTTTVLAKRSVGTDLIHYDAIVIGRASGAFTCSRSCAMNSV